MGNYILGLKEKLNQLYPLVLNRWKVILSIGVFIAFFMVFFQPFGLRSLERDHKLWLLAGYGLVTFLVLVFDLILLLRLFPRLLNPDRWTVKKEILWLLWIIVTISAGNYVYSVAFSIIPWLGIRGLGIFLGFTLLVSFFPVTAVIILSHNRLLRKHLEASDQMNRILASRGPQSGKEGKKLQIVSYNKKQRIVLDVSDLICIEATGNYIHLCYNKGDGARNVLIRNTLKNIEQALGVHDILFKCHRAYIVNLSYIEKIKGNSQGYRLKIKDMDLWVPVARSYAKTFRKKIDTLQ